MDRQLDIDQFLMFGLNDLCEEVEDHEMRAYAIAMTIAASGVDVPESMLKMYLTSCIVDEDHMNVHLSAFMGMNLLTVNCDCESHMSDADCLYGILINHHAFEIGHAFLQANSMEYLDAKDRVAALRFDLQN